MTTKSPKTRRATLTKMKIKMTMTKIVKQRVTSQLMRFRKKSRWKNPRSPSLKRRTSLFITPSQKQTT